MQCIFFMEQLFHNFWIWYVLNFEKAEEVKESGRVFEKILSTTQTTEILFLISATQPELDCSQSLVLKMHTHKCLYDRVILFVLSSAWSRRCSVSRGPGLFLSLKGICLSFLFSFSLVETWFYPNITIIST